MKILAIETSCDETAASIVETKSGKFNILSQIVSSQIEIHKKTNGIVPEVAAREHVKNIIPVIKKALGKFNIQKDIDYIAVTAGPGLITSLMVGLEAAKTLAYVNNKKLIGVNHLEAHLCAAFLDNQKVSLPAIGLVVSGGHTAIYLMKDIGKYKFIGGTRDDAAGEAFDKVAKFLGLSYPGGPIISQLAKKGNPKAFNYPRPMINSKDYDFSFSGIKTSVLYDYFKNKKKYKNNLEDVAASFQQAVVDVLVYKTIKAAKEYNAKSVILAGGVAANEFLREALKNKADVNNTNFFVPEFEHCTDNATMIASAAYFKVKNKQFSDVFKLKADPNWELA